MSRLNQIRFAERFNRGKKHQGVREELTVISSVQRRAMGVNILLYREDMPASDNHELSDDGCLVDESDTVWMLISYFASFATIYKTSHDPFPN